MSEKTSTTKVQVKCIVRYYDKKLKRIVEVGETLKVTGERANALREALVAE